MARSLSLLVLLGLLGASPSVAGTEEYWAESEPMGSRPDALAVRDAVDLDALVKELSDESLTVRVVRRFLQGEGWAYVVRVDGVEGEEAARGAARVLARAGVGAGAWTREGDEVHLLEEARPPVLLPAAPEGPGGRAGAEARQVLRAAVRAHGGTAGGIALLEQTDALSFAYERTVPMRENRLVASNRFWRSGEAARLEVEVVEGEGVDSTTLLTLSNEAVVQVGDSSQARDPARTREVLARFSPEVVLAIPLGIARDIEEADAWQDLVMVGTERIDGASAWHLAPVVPQSGADGLVGAWFSEDGGTLRRALWQTSAGRMQFDFEDYRETAPELRIPWKIRVQKDGKLVEEIRVLDLVVDPILDAGLFLEP